MELSKSQKKKVRALIELGLRRDYIDGIKRIKKLCDSMTDYESNPKENYHKLYNTIFEKDKDISRRYDDLRGSQYLLRLIILVREGVLSKEDLKELDEELKQRVLSII